MTRRRKITTPTQTRLRLLILALLCTVTFSVFGFHIIGGEITYRCTGIPADTTMRNYAFKMTVYRDCAGVGAQFDNPAEIGIYSHTGNFYTFVRAVMVSHGPVTQVPPPNDPCLIIPGNVCVQQAVYTFNMTLPVINGSYIVFWRRCCRNQTINNIVDPRNTGATFSVEITALAQQVCNDSPTFKGFPPTVICVNQPLQFDHSAVDQQGDQLVYEFCAPLEGGGPAGNQGNMELERACNGIRPDPAGCPPPFTPVTFIGPNYTVVNPLGGNPRVTINANTGMIFGTPLVIGQFVVGVCVKEYRNGQLLSVLQRDFQFNVSTCELAVEAEIQSDTTLNGERFVVNSCGDFTVDFTNLSQRESNIVSYEWEFDLGNEVVVADTRNTSVTFPGLGTYLGSMIINRGFSCTDTAQITVNVYPEIRSDFEFEYDTCFGAPVEFTDQSFSGSGQLTNWSWSFGDGNSSVVRNPNHLYPIPGNHNVTLRVRDINQCEDQKTQVIPYFPVPPVIIVDPSTYVGCEPATITFNNLSTPIDESYDIRWDFGDGNTSDEISPTHIYNDAGVYSLHIEITSPIGCFIETDFGQWITVRPSPQAGFNYSPQELSNFISTVYFTDASVDAVGWQWTFGNEGLAFIASPTYEFRDTGIYSVQQVVFHENGCTDTAFAVLDVTPLVSYFLPNAFTPNYDSKNDTYKGVGVLEGMTDFEFSVWARWGERVFYTRDPDLGWNGRKDNTGEDLPDGVYVCVVRYTDPRNQPVEIKEFATLLR